MHKVLGHFFSLSIFFLAKPGYFSVGTSRDGKIGGRSAACAYVCMYVYVCVFYF
jgi:hypothetical protein